MNETFLCFQFANVEIKLPEKIVYYYYEWLANLFNLINIGSDAKKTHLDYNLLSYVENKNLTNIRNMIYVLKFLEKIYDNDCSELDKIKKINTLINELSISKYKYVFKITEDFLKNGPGNIKGIDKKLKCKKCKYETYEIPYYQLLNKLQRPLHKHDFYKMNEYKIICNHCGKSFSSFNNSLMNDNKYNYCIRYNEECYDHNFDL